MIKFSSLLRESLEWKDITIQDVEDRTANKWNDRESTSLLKVIESFFNGENEENRNAAIGYLSLLNDVAKLVIQLTTNIPYVDIKTIKSYLLSLHEFHNDIDEFFPFPVYVSSSSEDEATIGVMINQQGKILEIHEGNDEATPETINMVNRMVNPSGKKVRIYASHNTKLVQEIEISEYLPKNLYVSPYRNHASGYLDLSGERSMFTGIIDVNSVNQESDLDWRTLDKTKIEKFRWL